MTPAPTSHAELLQVYGDPRPFTHEDGSISPEWELKILTLITLPAPILLGWTLPGELEPRPTARLRCHRLVAANLAEVFRALHAEGHWPLLKTLDGCYAWRRQRNAQVPSLHCLQGDALVSTPRGWLPIAELKVGDTAFTYPDRDAHAVSNTFSGRREDLLEVRTRNRALRASPEHPFYVLRCNHGGRGVVTRLNKRYWVEQVQARDLCPGDWTLLLTHEPQQPGGSFSEAAAEAVGMFLGDGNLVHRRTGPRAGACDGVRLSIPQEDLYREHAITILTGLFGAPRLSPFGIFYDKGAVGQWFQALGLDHSAREKRLPPWVWGLGHRAKLALLRGYICTDGTVSASGEIRCKAGSRELIAAMRALFISLGFSVSNVFVALGSARIIKGISTISRDEWAFSATDTRRVLDLSAHERHGARLEAWKARTWRARVYRGKGRGGAWLPEFFGVDPVVSVREAGRAEVFDITVEDRHNFIAGGLVVSNCWGLAVDLNAYLDPQGDTIIDMPGEIVSVFRRFGWRWGGNFKGGRIDGMHYDWYAGRDM